VSQWRQGRPDHREHHAASLEVAAMRPFSFSGEDLNAIAHDRYHHAHPQVQRKMGVLWLKSHGLPHRQIADLAGVSLRTVQRYLDDYLQGGLTRVRHCNWRGPKTALLQHERYPHAEIEAMLQQQVPNARINSTTSPIAAAPRQASLPTRKKPAR
jgi:hypothetical protein